MTSYRATHIRIPDGLAVEAVVKQAMRSIRVRGGRVVDLKIDPGGADRPARAIVLYEVEDEPPPVVGSAAGPASPGQA